MTRIYTKTGDKGQTSLWGGGRISKDDLRVETYGSLDELNSAIGVVIACGIAKSVEKVLIPIQCDLFQLGAEFAAADRSKLDVTIGESHVERLENAIDEFDEKLEPLKAFILPGGGTSGAHCHMARTICRRAERLAVSLAKTNCDQTTVVSEFAIQYLNRLSDLLFVLARAINADHDTAEVTWLPEKSEK